MGVPGFYFPSIFVFAQEPHRSDSSSILQLSAGGRGGGEGIL